jgi:NAD(P)-dependent dehydrogenase (short-subunit alcohol dehydrogenase family)
MMDILPPDRQQELLAPQAMTRFGEPSEVAESMVWLISDRASFVTGTAMSVDAGAMACG